MSLEWYYLEVITKKNKAWADLVRIGALTGHDPHMPVSLLRIANVVLLDCGLGK